MILLLRQCIYLQISEIKFWGLIQKVAKALDLVTGSHFEATVSVWREDIYGFYDRFAKKHGNGTYEEKFKPLDLDQMMSDAGIKPERFNYGDSYKNGYNGGTSIVDGIKNTMMI